MARADVPSVDETFELLSHSRGRFVLQYFDQNANPIKLEDIAPMVARWEAHDGANPSDEEVELVSERLHDEYLPWLADLGLVSYDANGRMVRYDPTTISTALGNADETLKFVWNGGPEDGTES
jgi:hypothetical protein